jgi:hypothetical protein
MESHPNPNPPDPRDKDGNGAPETPLDEPQPPRVQDPPPQPAQKGPYTVGMLTRHNTEG